MTDRTDATKRCRCYDEPPPPGVRARCRLCGREVIPEVPRHECHADHCTEEVPAKMFMCLRHWRMVPRALQREIWRHYVPGQEVRKDPTDEYMEVAVRAIKAVSEREKRDEEKGTRL